MSAYLKALYAAAAAGLASLATILVGTHATFSQVTDGQWVTVAIAVLGAGAVVWGVPNTPAKSQSPVIYGTRGGIVRVHDGDPEPPAPAPVPQPPPVGGGGQ